MNKIISVISTLLCCWSTPTVFANTNGEVMFQGAIIDAPQCQTVRVNTRIQLDCSINNNTLSESEIVVDSQLEYLDQAKKSAVMQIIYH